MAKRGDERMEAARFGFLDGGAGQMGDWGCGRAGKEVVWCP